MRRRTLNYNLENGYIDHWLAAGPQETPINLNDFPEDDIRAAIVAHYYQPESGITDTPVERGPLDKGLFKIGDYTGSWEYYACREDHQVDHSAVYPAARFLRSWAYTQLTSKAEQEAQLVLTATGPFDLWLNGEHLHRQVAFYDQEAGSTRLQVTLKKGVNKVLLRFETAALGSCAHAVALRVCAPGQPLTPYPPQSGIHVTLPTLIENLAQRNTFEKVYRAAYTIQDVFQTQDHIRLYWPEEGEDSPAVIRLQTPGGRILAEATVDGTPGDNVFLSYPPQVPAGPYRLLIIPPVVDYYDNNLRITQERQVWNMSRQSFSSTPYGTYAGRRQEALVAAIQMGGLFGEIAKMALGRWEKVDPSAILERLDSLQRVDLLGLLGMMARYEKHAVFPQELRAPVEAAILGFPYGSLVTWNLDESEFQNHGVLTPALEILAGQRYPDKRFAASGENGGWHRERGEELALAWLHHVAAYGFPAWDSPLSFSEHIMALSHLVDLADSETIVEMSTVVMDKLFTTIAINSFQGVFGSTQGRTRAAFVKGGNLEPTSGITRLLWGTGVFNQHSAGSVSLACMQRYELPALIDNIALSKAEALWSRERHALPADREVNKVTYKTPEAMLCSAQDYFPGERGRQEHIWQATLGPAATVFVNHPACSSESDARQPNFWAGNAVLPRVAQWKDVLIALYKLPEDDWMGFTHAYFPLHAFEEYKLDGGWAFARVGDGYLALGTSQGLDLIRTGRTAFRELRAYGREQVWLCHLGREALDGSFETFQEKVCALPLAFEGHEVRFTTLRGEALAFGWQAPFTRDGQQQPLSGFMHYEHPFAGSKYPSTEMVVGYGEDLLRLNFDR